MPSVKPKLEKLTTPVTANFPSAVHSSAVTSPLSATSFQFKVEPDLIKTPISPPMAYMDFLTKAKALGSPSTPPALSSGEITPDSLPDTSASSEASDCSCKSARPSPTSIPSKKPSTPATAPFVPPSPFPTSAPMSAPLSGPASFPSLKLPPSPAISSLDSPLTPSTAMSPFSARSLHSVFDWEAALKARYAEQKKQKSNRTSVRHIREVVTRTVTYTPRMEPAPRGKRRKVE